MTAATRFNDVFGFLGSCQDVPDNASENISQAVVTTGKTKDQSFMIQTPWGQKTQPSTQRCTFASFSFFVVVRDATSHNILEFCARVPARRPELGPGSPS